LFEQLAVWVGHVVADEAGAGFGTAHAGARAGLHRLLAGVEATPPGGRVVG
jgi:hypothetical protein